MPKAVASAVKGKFPGMKVVGAEKEDEDGKVVYEIKLKAKGATLEAVLTAKGDVLKVTVKKGEDDEDDDKGKKKGDDKKGFQGEQKGQYEDKDDKKGEDKKGKKKGEDDGNREKGEKKKGD